MQCVFARRRYVQAQPTGITLPSLFSKATVTRVSGRNASSASTVSISRSSYFPAGTAYLFSVFNGYFGIWKMVDKAFVTTPIFQQDQNYGGVVEASATASTVYYRSGGYIVGGTSYRTSVYGAQLVVVTFDNTYTVDEIDATLGAIQATRLAAHNDASAAYVTIPLSTAQAHSVVLAARSSTFGVYQGNSTMTKLCGTSTDAATIYSTTNFTLGSSGSSSSVYGGSLIGLD